MSLAGSRLAADSTWWGQQQDERPGSVIDCTPTAPGEWNVRVADAIGMVVVDELQLLVEPKIPLHHLLYLLEVGGYIPRVSHELGLIGADTSLWRLVAGWYVGATERLIRRDLRRDYHLERGVLPAVRGQIAALDTARDYYAGRLGFRCEYDEFGFDTPLNRVLKRAAQIVAASTVLDRTLRRRAFELLSRMDAVGRFEVRDLRARTDRNSSYYREAHGWARHVVLACGRTPAPGQHDAWTFLIRTPEPVEEGIRKLLQRALGEHRVLKRGKRLQGSHLTLNPDLVFPVDGAVADVKYKLSESLWNRADLYQLVTFAVGFGVREGTVISFSAVEQEPLETLAIGNVRLSHLPWVVDEEGDPAQEAAVFVDRALAWLEAVAGGGVSSRGNFPSRDVSHELSRDA